jgi:hypothetical protein
VDNFARRDGPDRLAFFSEAAARRDVTPIIIEKDFWVCWVLRRLMETPGLGEHLTFKGGTSLSKAYGIIDRFSEDVDLTIGRTAPQIGLINSPLEVGISRNERDRRTKALKAAGRDYVHNEAMPALEAAIAKALGSRSGWNIVFDTEDMDAQTILFEYPSVLEYDASGAAGYIKPRIKLEFGARGQTEPSEQRTIMPYLALEFPGELTDAKVTVSTLSAERTFWEKATILHALHHGSKMRPEMSRHFYDIVMMAASGVDDAALADPDLLTQVVAHKSQLFADPKASYETAALGSLRLAPTAQLSTQLRDDYRAMGEMFMSEPPTFEQLMSRIVRLEAKLNR